MNAAGIPAATSPLRREARACSQVSRPSGVRMISTCGAPGAGFPFSSGSCSSSSCSSRAAGWQGVLGQHVYRGLVRGQRFLPGQRGEHRLIESGFPQLRRQAAACLVHPARRDRNPQQHGHDLRGPLRRHVPVRGQHHRGGVQHRPVGHRAGVRARRRLRERDRPAARALQARQRPLGRLPEDHCIDDLRPPRARGRRAAQAGPTLAALRRRLRVLVLIRIRIPLQALAPVPGLPASLAVPARLFDCCRARRASLAPIRSFELGTPESWSSIDRRRSSSASRSSSRRLSSRSASSSARSTAFSASFASTTARSRDSSSRCPAISPDGPGSSGTSPKHARPALKVQTPGNVGVSHRHP